MTLTMLSAAGRITEETSMDVRSAVAFEAGNPLDVPTVQLEVPRAAEVLKRTARSQPDAFIHWSLGCVA